METGHGAVSQWSTTIASRRPVVKPDYFSTSGRSAMDRRDVLKRLGALGAIAIVPNARAARTAIAATKAARANDAKRLAGCWLTPQETEALITSIPTSCGGILPREERALRSTSFSPSST